MLVGLLGAGEMEEKPTKSFMFMPWAAETGFGAANCVPDTTEDVVRGKGRLGIVGRDVLGTCVLAGAEMKSSNSSSSAAVVPPFVVDASDCIPLDAAGFGGVIGGTSSSPNSKRSTSGAFFVSTFFFAELLGVGSAFRRAGVLAAPSSSSSYSSKRSLRVLLPDVPESWKPEL